MFARLSLLAAITTLGAIMGSNVLAQTSSSCQTIHTVVQGDNCQALAATFNITDAALLAANPSVDSTCSNLFVGEQLCIPPAPTPPSCQATYTVVSGDNCVAIAAKFNVSDASLLAANPQVDEFCDNLNVGEQLCIPEPPTVCTQGQYTVVAGDTCISIGVQFNITATQLEAANSEINANCSNLDVGEVLCIP
ncbi:hypothetical protein BDP27DRAFT_823732 [Rhodocollybia butyracea]|uniref:LysM domain-containing protein n=1 Tax=Rhodocollybia butyracea TaxID=206335 RepID=A0A9P5PUN7_9AGAR|nr:hypothetical protein BDP27DRAFT_823732 [Rhodocollybia butyracea]